MRALIAGGARVLGSQVPARGHARLEAAPEARRGGSPPVRDAEPRVGGRPGAWRRHRQAVAEVLVLYLVGRLVVLAATLTSAALRPGDVSDALLAWDAGWFLATAREGYPAEVDGTGTAAQSTIAFLPAFPGLIALGLALGVPPPLAGPVVAVVAGAASAGVVYALGVRLSGSAAGRRAAALFCVFPGSFALGWGYSEGLAALLAGGCLLAALDRRWLTAGVLAGLATATRADMLVLVPALLVAAAQAQHVAWRAREGVRALLQPLVAPALAPLGFLAFQCYLWQQTGQPAAWFSVQREGWGQQTSVLAPYSLVLRVVDGLPASAADGIEVLAVLVLLAMLAAAWRAGLPLVLWTYTVALLLLSTTSTAVGLRPRALLLCLPLFVAVGIVARPLAYRAAVLACAGSLPLLTLAYLVLPSAGTP